MVNFHDFTCNGKLACVDLSEVAAIRPWTVYEYADGDSIAHDGSVLELRGGGVAFVQESPEEVASLVKAAWNQP